MRKIILTLCLFAGYSPLFAQRHQLSDYGSSIIPIEKQSLLKDVDLIANMRCALVNRFEDGKFDQSYFSNQVFRLEIKGYVTRKLYFRFRDKYTELASPQSLDNISLSTDMAFLRYDLSDKWSFSMGKLYIDWGGWEYDYNPIDIYRYSELMAHSDVFLTGLGAAYNADTNHTFSLQVLNSHSKSIKELHQHVTNITPAKAPLALAATWHGSMFGDHFNTIWSASVLTEAKNNYVYYFAFGNQYKQKKWLVEYDLKFSIEELDRTGIIESLLPVTGNAVQNTRYISHWLHGNYQITDRLHVGLVAMQDKASWYKNGGSQLIRTTWSLIPSVEYYPIKNYNLRIFAAYIGRFHKFSDYARSEYALKDNNWSHFSLGFMVPVLLL